ncbi:hypothetical protein LB941_06340 [Ligilactobacillus sp. WILCCON 0076]|uniref:Uncharacterized protein n=1 Tax=Ligilactobacillus ubinensis TaxID=2876789 RepID=A0A9X2JMC1_9LACO|nr:hypothetical protein [Ligilactobacillus ubinensis]MCP0886951.1 hypothetical protein [Ligilactobacillus ubinensis]
MTDYDVPTSIAQALIELEKSAYKAGLDNLSIIGLKSHREHVLGVLEKEISRAYDSGWNSALEELKHRNEAYEAY